MKWTYCECGCHGHTARAGSIDFWLFNDLKGNFYLHLGHGWLGRLIGKYDSINVAQNKAKEIIQEEINSLKSSLNK